MKAAENRIPQLRRLDRVAHPFRCEPERTSSQRQLQIRCECMLGREALGVDINRCLIELRTGTVAKPFFSIIVTDAESQVD